MHRKRLSFALVLMALVLSVAMPAQAAGRPEPAPLLAVESPIPDQYIVVYRENARPGAADAAIARLSGNAEFALLHRYEAAINGFAARLSHRNLGLLRADPGVAYIEADGVVTIDATQTGATWGIDRIDQRNLPLTTTYTYNNTGAGVTAYIIDTGIRFTHTEFGGRAVSGYDFVDNDSDAGDCNGHGTHVAGTVGGSTYGVAKGVSLVAVRVLNCSGSGTWSGVIAGIDWVTAKHTSGPAVANMSLGGAKITSVNDAVTRSIADGVTYAVAAGNDSSDACRKSPASTPNAITVGATTNTDARASYSNYGACLDLFAPGSNITSAYNTSDTATAVASGTSMASPHVAGVAALFLQSNPTASPATLRNALVNNATPGVVKKPGRNSPNLLLFTNY